MGATEKFAPFLFSPTSFNPLHRRRHPEAIRSRIAEGPPFDFLLATGIAAPQPSS